MAHVARPGIVTYLSINFAPLNTQYVSQFAYEIFTEHCTCALTPDKKKTPTMLSWAVPVYPRALFSGFQLQPSILYSAEKQNVKLHKKLQKHQVHIFTKLLNVFRQCYQIWNVMTQFYVKT